MLIRPELVEVFCPGTLRDLRSWALWRLEQRAGQAKPGKIPYTAQRGQPQRVKLLKLPDGSADWIGGPWANYDAASAVLQERPGIYGGLDLALLPGSGIVALDLDHCVDPDGTVSGVAAEILERIQGKTFVELSQSGSGLHAFFRGSLPGGSFNNQAAGVEMYAEKHYVAMTFRALPGCAVEPAADQQELINELAARYRPQPAAGPADDDADAAAGQPGHCDLPADEVIQRIRRSRQGPKFERLMAGNVDGYSSGSEADLALAGILAFWCERDPDLIEEIFSRSVLAARGKWDREDYRELTIRNAIRGCRQTRGEFLQARREEILKSFPSGCWNDPDGLAGIFRQRREEFHLFRETKNGVTLAGVNHREICDALAELPLLVIDGEPWLYSGGAYQRDVRGIQLRSLIRACLYDKYCTSRNIAQIYEQLISLPQLQAKFEEMNAFPRGYIVFKNGVLDAETGEILEHRQSFRAINAIPHEFKPGEARDGGPVDAFVGGLWPDPDDQRFLWELVGASMLARLWPEFFIILRGEGGLGKSVFLNLLQDALGPDNCASLSLGQLQQRFLALGLRGRLADICGDLKSEALRTVDVLKRLTGADPISTEIKGGPVVEFRSYAVPWFSANRVPLQDDDRTNAYWRRLKVLPVRQRAPEIPNIKDALRGDLQTFLARAVAGAQRVLANDGVPVDSENCKTAVRELRRVNDPVAAFLEDCCEIESDARVKADELYQAFESFRTQGTENRDFYGWLSQGKFYEDLREKGFADVKINGARFFKGIVLRTQGVI